MGYRERKRERTEYYNTYIKGWKERTCTACNGSGHYDHNGSPPCGCCAGTGKERYRDLTIKE
jgi:DnaJ-class molecular chaperone